MDVLVIGEHPLVVRLAVVAGNAPVDVAGVRVSEVLVPGSVVFRRLELGFREDDVDLVDRVFLAPAVFDRRYPMLAGVGFEVERREVPLDEAGAGDERAWGVVEVHVLGPELRELGVDQPLPVEAIELDVHLPFLDDGFPGLVLADEVDGLLGKIPFEVLDDAAARRAHPKDGREREREVRAVFGEDEFGRLLVQSAVDDAHEPSVPRARTSRCCGGSARRRSIDRHSGGR